MKMMNRTPFALVALLAALAFAQDKTQLRRQLTVSEDKYAVTMEMKSSVDTPVGTQEFGGTGTMNYSVKIGKVDGEKADVEFITSDMKFESNSPVPAPDASAPVTVTGKIDNRNRITDVKMPATGQGMMQMLSGSGSSSMLYFYAELPEGNVAVGDTWKVVVPANQTSPKDAELTSTLVGEKDGAWIVKTTGVIPMEIDTSKLPKTEGQPDMDMMIKGKINFEGESLLDKATNKVRQSTIKNKIKSTIEVMGQNIDSSSDMTMTYKLKS